ncbi:MAG: sortase [Bacilli bacterium]
MFKKKIIKIIGLIILIITLSYITFNQYQKYNNIKKHTKIIEKDYKSGKISTDDNLNYIIIDDLKIKRIIAPTADQKTLDQYYVGLVSGNINNLIDNIVLAGHNVDYVFGKLHHITLGTTIILKSKQKETYIVTNKKEVFKNDTTILKTTNNQKILTLITCTNNDDKRLIITAIKK